MSVTRFAAVALAAALSAAPVFGQSSAIPQLSSRPGAAYTLYLNFGGFNFNGTWAGRTPGVVPAFDSYASNTSTYNPAVFTTLEQQEIQTTWSRTAEVYAAFNVNVTTVDPAVAAGQAGTDAQRQAYYNTQARMMQNIIGGTNAWYGGAGGVSYVGVAQYSYSGSTESYHTNWTFTRSIDAGTGVTYPYGTKSLAVIGTHELGHALRLSHQGAGSGGNYVDYDSGDANRGPVMGTPYNSQRGLWRNGVISSAGALQNDPRELLLNVGITGNGAAGFMDSGRGHTFANATALPLTGTAINSASATGLIAPNNTTPTALGGDLNYTTDFFRFAVGSGGANLIVQLRSGRSTLAAGVADPGATLDGTLRLLNAEGTVLNTANTGVLLESLTVPNLAPGTYYLQISSAGADVRYFDMGSYFLTGSIVPVPEPGLLLLAAAAGLAGVRAVRRRRAA